MQGPSVNGVDFRKLTSFDVLVSGLDPSTDSAAAPGDTQLSGGALAGTVIGRVSAALWAYSCSMMHKDIWADEAGALQLCARRMGLRVSIL